MYMRVVLTPPPPTHTFLRTTLLSVQYRSKLLLQVKIKKTSHSKCFYNNPGQVREPLYLLKPSLSFLCTKLRNHFELSLFLSLCSRFLQSYQTFQLACFVNKSLNADLKEDRGYIRSVLPLFEVIELYICHVLSQEDERCCFGQKINNLSRTKARYLHQDDPRVDKLNENFLYSVYLFCFSHTDVVFEIKAILSSSYICADALCLL